jgi:dephospho-CoA kinase
MERDTLRGLFTEEHSSEKELDDYKGFDYFVDNNGTIEELTEKLKQILKQIGL